MRFLIIIMVKTSMAIEGLGKFFIHGQEKTAKESAYIYSERKSANSPPGFRRRTKKAISRRFS